MPRSARISALAFAFSIAVAVCPGAPAHGADAPTGSFDDLEFPMFDSTWKGAMVNDDFVIVPIDVAPPERFSITLFATRDFSGDAQEFGKAFSDAVDRMHGKEFTMAKAKPATPLEIQGVASLRTNVVFDGGVRTIDAYGFLKGARSQIVAIESTPGAPGLEQRRRAAEAFVRSLAFTPRTDPHSNSVGAYVVDIEGMRATVEEAVRKALPASAAAEEVAAKLDAELKALASQNRQLELKEDRTYARSATRPATPGAPAVTSVETGRWLRDGDRLSLTIQATDGVSRPRVMTIVGTYERQGAIVFSGVRYVRTK